MFLNAKKVAFLGLLLAFAVLLVVFSGILEFNTLFLLILASYCVGIAIRETGIRLGAGFYLGGVFLSFIIAPNKLYCLTFAGLALYILIIEFAFDKLAIVTWKTNRKIIFWVIKYLVFNCMYLPVLFLFPRLIYGGVLSSGLYIILILGGEIGVFVFDSAYRYFQKYIWERLRQHL